jgi:hypothetical protein
VRQLRQQVTRFARASRLPARPEGKGQAAEDLQIHSSTAPSLHSRRNLRLVAGASLRRAYRYPCFKSFTMISQ